MIELLQIIAGALVAGFAQKQVNKLPNDLIPVINAVAGTVTGTLIFDDPVTGAQYGAVAAAAATGVHQLVKVGARAAKLKLWRF